MLLFNAQLFNKLLNRAVLKTGLVVMMRIKTQQNSVLLLIKYIYLCFHILQKQTETQKKDSVMEEVLVNCFKFNKKLTVHSVYMKYPSARVSVVKMAVLQL